MSASECKFWLLDLNYEVVDHEPEVWLWGVTEGGERVLLIDRGYLPYFYAVVEEGADPALVLKAVEEFSSSMPHVVKVELLERRLFGKPVKALKVTCRDPEELEKYAKKVAKVRGVKECLEDDVRYSMSYLIDKGLRPCGWHRAKVRPLDLKPKPQVDAVYEVVDGPELLPEEHGMPELRVLAFYMVAYSPRGSPKPKENPVVVLTALTGEGELRAFVADGEDDRGIIGGFCEFLRSYDPDVIFGFHSNDKLWPYLAERAKVLGINLPVGRTGAEPHTSVYGHVSITGRANVDLYDFAEKDLPAVKVKTLENVADYLGIMPLEGREVLDPPDIKLYWEDETKREKLVEFCRDNVRCVMGIGRSVLSFAVQLSNLTGIPLDHALTAAVGFRVEWTLIRAARRRGELVPKRAERRHMRYVGGMVLKPKEARIYERIAVLDYKSLYPSIMIQKNVSPDTYVPPDEPEPPEGVNVAPEVGHRFRKEPPGLYKEVLSVLIKARDEVRERLRALKPEDPLYRLLDARQKALKVVANATYGYAGWLGARWYLKPVAESVTAWGRYTIKRTIEMAEEMGIELIYGDTDSVFVKYEPEKVERFLKAVEEEFGLKIKPDEIFERVLFTEAKKRYCGLLPSGKLEIVGLEAVRGDWSGVAKKVQRGVLEIVLKTRNPSEARKKAVKFVREWISKLRAGEVPLKDLVIWEELTKKPEEYKVRAAHVRAAEIMMEEGWDVSVGDKIGYVIIKGTG
ncbi:MAG TPA: DNA polymerase II, partial [Candidatus Bathyarchaeota archaeon]|nr:DNA polymerase II [Candidatus Bathyarchaeota archaeon]